MTLRRTAPAVLLGSVLALTGCTTGGAPAPEDQAAAVLDTARAYQSAAVARDWRRTCELSTARYRAGTVQQCTARKTGSTPAPAPEATADSTATHKPPAYADGSTMRPLPSRTSRPGPDRASTGPVTPQGQPVDVPASGDHPAGYGVLLTYTVTWPTETSTARKALRLVQEEGAWRVDQTEDVHDGDEAMGRPVQDALAGRP
ncbi:hypothetical protein [Streptomyces sp. NPDC088557]|uniref:hypothetical protein n=1 Tax=Streptomyces sp. NPDC088557 TaxID=3365867 RepID=UPI003808CD09